MKSKFSWIRNATQGMQKAIPLFAMVALPVVVQAQPTPAPTTPEQTCGTTPTGALGANDTILDVFDKDGFTTIFDGSSFKGWWQNCNSGHTRDKVKGAIWKISPDHHAMYSTQRGTSGGHMLTKKKYLNYEIVFDFWPDYGNDGGFFNRTSAEGTCYQTVMDYLTGASLLGSYPEGKSLPIDHRPFVFTGEDGAGIGPIQNKGEAWQSITATLSPTTFGCPAGGCMAADWKNNWNTNDWNQIKIRYYGGVTNATRIHMQSFFRKNDTKPWIPVANDSVELGKTDPAGYIGFQVHGGGSFGGPAGNWYRNVKVRYLKDDGSAAPFVGPTSFSSQPDLKVYGIEATASALLGAIDVDYQMTLKDMNGRMLESFSGHAGAINHAFRTSARGLMILEIKSARGIASQRISRIR
jgi:hypothetical protein